MTAAPHPPDRWPRRAAAMAVLALAAAALAWFLGPAPLVGNAPQTELLSIQGLGAGGERLCWRPQSVVERQAARALVDRMAGLEVHYTLRPRAPAGRPVLTLFFRTEEHYQVVALYRRGAQWEGLVRPQDGDGPLAARLARPGELAQWVEELLPGALAAAGFGEPLPPAGVH